MNEIFDKRGVKNEIMASNKEGFSLANLINSNSFCQSENRNICAFKQNAMASSCPL